MVAVKKKAQALSLGWFERRGRSHAFAKLWRYLL
jgi:hypothetical protein